MSARFHSSGASGCLLSISRYRISRSRHQEMLEQLAGVPVLCALSIELTQDD
jgi:hypothetical protein